MNLNDIEISHLSIKEIAAIEKNISGEELNTLSRLFLNDPRSSVQKRGLALLKKYDKYVQEQKRLDVITMRENVLHNEGYSYIAGIDEVGRGPLFGPVVAAAVIMPENSRIEYINDSKQLSQKKREELYEIILNEAVDYAVGIVDNNVIDEINILNATKLAMLTAVNNLNTKPDMLLLDAVELETEIPQQSVIKGDSNVYCIAAASIVAKVVRDRMMDEYAEEYPQYHLEKNKGYGTQEHLDAINKFGDTPLHRKTFISKLDVTSDTLGRRCEEFVKSYLTGTLGYELIEQRYRAANGEIDLIMQDHGQIVFVEVKGRDINSLHEGEDFLTHSKKRRIIAAAEVYMQDNDSPSRFDLVAVKYNAEEGRIKNLRHYKNAFEKNEAFNDR